MRVLSVRCLGADHLRRDARRGFSALLGEGLKPEHRRVRQGDLHAVAHRGFLHRDRGRAVRASLVNDREHAQTAIQFGSACGSRSTLDASSLFGLGAVGGARGAAGRGGDRQTAGRRRAAAAEERWAGLSERHRVAARERAGAAGRKVVGRFGPLTVINSDGRQRTAPARTPPRAPPCQRRRRARRGLRGGRRAAGG
jgi:hypothetical protein